MLHKENNVAFLVFAKYFEEKASKKPTEAFPL